MIEARRAQLSFAEGLIAEEVSDLWEDWMRPADQVLDDDQLLTTVYEALAKRSPKSRTLSRRGTPAEGVLRLLLLKHVRNWRHEVVEREVRANLVYRSFTRVGGGKVPDDIESHEEQLGPTPRVVAGDAAFYSAANEKQAHEKGVKRVCVSHRSTKSAERKREQKNPGSEAGRTGGQAVRAESAVSSEDTARGDASIKETTG